MTQTIQIQQKEAVKFKKLDVDFLVKSFRSMLNIYGPILSMDLTTHREKGRAGFLGTYQPLTGTFYFNHIPINCHDYHWENKSILLTRGLIFCWIPMTAVLGEGGGKSGVGGCGYPVGLTGYSVLTRLERLLSNSRDGGLAILLVVCGISATK